MIKSIAARSTLIFSCFIVLSYVGFAGTGFAQNIPESIVIEHNIHRLDIFGPVHFGHLKHIELGLDCKQCHHDWNENSNELPIGCVNCHGRDRVKDIVSLRTAYMKKCLGCHIVQGPDGKKTGPTICTMCHQYKNK